MNEIISRRDAVCLGLKRYFTGIPCKFGHIVERFCSNNKCLDCHRKNSKHFREERAESAKNSSAKYRQKNRTKEYERWRLWVSKNIARNRSLKSKHRAKKADATPKWLTDTHCFEIYCMYQQSISLEQKTGVKHHVDHIVPLNGKNVSGLHVPWNLQVIPAKENLKKSNKFND